MKTAIVTGAYGTIGMAIVQGISKIADYQIIVIGKNCRKLDSLCEELSKSTDHAKLISVVLDLSNKEAIRNFAENLGEPIHILVNNAATTPRQRTVTHEGIELQFATNVLGYYWMMEYLHPRMKGLDDARIVNVASYWAGGLDLDDLEYKTRKYDNDSAYRQSKQADRMLSVAFADKLKPFGITVNSCHPGDVNSQLSNDLGFGGHETPEKGAATPVFLATSPQIKGVTGKYFADKKEQYCEFSEDRYGIQSLIEQCEKY